MRPEKLYLIDIVEAAEAIQRFVGSQSKEDFWDDDLRQSAVLHQLMVIGEAAARLSAQFKAQYPQVEWQQIIGFRNVLVHAYFSLSLPIIWATIVDDIPNLRRQIAEILAEEFR